MNVINMGIRAGLAVGFLALALAERPAAQGSSPTYRALMQGGVPVPEARGVWQSRGYGWILDLRNDGFTVYHRSAAGCSADPRRNNFIRQFSYRQTHAKPGQLVLFAYPGETRYVFDRVERLPQQCGLSNWTPKRIFEHFAATYSEQFAFFKERGVDWEERVKAHRPLVTEQTSPRVLFAVFSDMLDNLGDPHVGLNARFGGEPSVFRTGQGVTVRRIVDVAARAGQPLSEALARWDAAYDRGIRQAVLDGKFEEGGNGKVVWGRIGNDIGYINLSAVQGFTTGSLVENIRYINDLMDRILGEFDGVRAVIVDITRNDGGYDRVAREIAGRFAGQRTLAYDKRPYGVKDVEPDVFYTEPSEGRRFLGPTFLLTSDVTVSGGEVVALAMRVLPNVTQVGTATRGALSDRLVKVLPDGSDFSISNEIYLDPQGNLFEAIGVPPHRQLDIFPVDDLDEGHAKAVEKLVSQIRSGAAARRE